MNILSCFGKSLEISQSYEKELDEFDRAKEQQDHVLEELVPKMNKEATKLIDVYSMDDLIESDVLDSLKDDAISVLKANPEDLPWVYARFKTKFWIHLSKNVSLLLFYIESNEHF